VNDKQTLADFFHVAKDVYPVGRLDNDSEGLLILTNDSAVNHRLLHPKFFHKREYYAQVDGAITQEALQKLQNGVDINIDGKIYHTKKCEVSLFENEPNLPERNPPIRFRKNIPATWIKIILREGKNRQVRKMCAKVGFPVLRLIRFRIGKINLQNLQPGEMKELSKEIIYKNLFDE
jgi:23S rRNA pseudouridine2457 synthase